MARLTRVTGREDEAAKYQAILESLANPRPQRDSTIVSSFRTTSVAEVQDDLLVEAQCR